MQKLLCITLLCGSALTQAADKVPAGLDAKVENIIKASYDAAKEDYESRLLQDEAQRLCSQYRNQPPKAVRAKIEAAEKTGIVYPADGKLLGDWKEGAKLANSGRGGRIGKIQPDGPDVKKGGNCYACHGMAPKELAFGNLGPSLTGYGKQRGNSPEIIKYTYDKIYNAQAFNACSNMPRFGRHQWLTPEEIAHAVAFLIDPESPVNKE